MAALSVAVAVAGYLMSLVTIATTLDARPTIFVACSSVEAPTSTASSIEALRVALAEVARRLAPR